METLPKGYSVLNKELMMLMFSIEKACGVGAGSGKVWNKQGSVRSEVSDVKHIFAYIAITYLGYTYKQVRDFLGMKYDSNITYAISRVEDLIMYNIAYRNRLYSIAVDCGIMGLIYHIIKVVDGK